MALTDPLGDMLTRIRNGQQAKQGLRDLPPASKLRAHVLEVLEREGYIRGHSEDERWTQSRRVAHRAEVFRGRARDQAPRSGSPSRAGACTAGSQRPADACAVAWASPSCPHPKGVLSDAEAREQQRRRRSAGGGVLMSRIGKTTRGDPKSGVTANYGRRARSSMKGPKGTLTMDRSRGGHRLPRSTTPA